MDIDKLKGMPEFKFLMDCVDTTVSNAGKTLGANNKYEDVKVFEDDKVAKALVMAVSDLRQNGACWLLDYPPMLSEHAGILVLGASQYLLGGHALLEAGRAFAISDNGVSFNPPPLAETLKEVYLKQAQLYSNALDRFANRS
jgi:hypothetical protein